MGTGLAHTTSCGQVMEVDRCTITGEDGQGVMWEKGNCEESQG